uniref:Uncharacterized protein n=1 Tax=Brassica oleracea TaxID=3712 RepID=A0A3P6GMP3_BRAOL|nr:unnamed protein product [Brassica oleracea]
MLSLSALRPYKHENYHQPRRVLKSFRYQVFMLIWTIFFGERIVFWSLRMIEILILG